MELTGSSYLLALASTGMAFVAFSTIVIVVRASMGGELSKSHLLVTRFYIELGFQGIAMSLLPLLLWTLAWPESLIWRVSSLASASLGAFWMVSAYRRQGAVASRPKSKFVRFNDLIGWSIVAYQLSNVIGVPIEPWIGPHAVTISWQLVLSGLMFLHSWDAFFRPSERKTRDESSKNGKGPVL